MSWSLPGSSIHGILQARILEWVTIPFSRGSFWPRDQIQISGNAGGLFFYFNSLSHQGSPMALCKGSDTELGDKNLPECICYFRGRWRMKDVLCSHNKNQGYDVVIIKITSVQFSHSVVSDSLRPHGLQHARPPCPSPTPRVYSNSQSLLISIELVMPSNHLILCRPLLLPSIFKITEGR